MSHKVQDCELPWWGIVDIMPMDVCHLLLGRSWQFDHHAIHDGYANTYSMTKDGVRHKLKPLKEAKDNVCCDFIIYLFDGRNFLEDMRHEHMCFSLIPKVGKEEVQDVPTKVIYILQEF